MFHNPLKSFFFLITCITTLAFTSLSFAQEQTTPPTTPTNTPAPATQGLLPVPNYSGDINTRTHLTGDWNGTRNDLANQGIQVESQWTQIIQSVTEGGRSTGTKYGGSLDYNVTLDLMKMDVMPGALVKFRAESRYGESVNPMAGPILPANTDALFPLTDSIDKNIPFTITNLNYTQFLSEKLAVVLGKFDTLDGDPNEFASGRGTSQFMNSNLVFAGPLALATPYSTLGAGVIIMPHKHLTISSLVVNTADSSTTTGFDDFGDGWTSSTEAQFQYQINNLPGGANLGFAYASDADFTQINGEYSFPPGTGLTPTTEDHTWTLYLNAWQYLYAEDAGSDPVNLLNGQPDHQGYGLFARIAFADKDTNPSDFFASAGLGGRGTLPNRDNDTFGVGYYYMSIQDTRFTTPLNIESSTQGLEAFYNIAINPSVNFTLDAQIIEAAFSNNDTAVVLGIRLNIKL